jgi:tetratricopeptide (TPR) repeat protein
MALALVDAALAQTGQLPPTVRAVVLRQKAHALAGLGEEQACSTVIFEALEAISGSGDTGDEGSLAPYCTTGYLTMEAATCWLQLGQPDRAVTAFTQASQVWPSHLRRDHGLHLARRASAHAGVGDIAPACGLATQAIDTVRQTASARTVRELRRVADRLDPWRTRQDAGAVVTAVATLAGSTI